jgi:DNA-binding SARP family transcriptional activator/tetratricopeptide (TPR) repeat protein
VGVLGSVAVWRDGHEVSAGQPRQQAILGVLACRANQVVSRSELVDGVWGDNPPATVGNGIYTYVAGLRRVLEPDRPPRSRRDTPGQVLVSSGGGYLLRLDPGCLDAGQFEECLALARRLRAEGDVVGAAQAMDQAIGLWRGQAFAGVPGPFAEGERLRLGELRTTAAEERADLMLLRGHAAAAVPELTALVADYPLRERARGLLMTALYRCGRQAEALQVFHDTRARLAEDLGIDPGTELTRIYQQVLALDPVLDGPAVQPPASRGAQPPASRGAQPPASKGAQPAAGRESTAASLARPSGGTDAPAAQQDQPLASTAAPTDPGQDAGDDEPAPPPAQLPAEPAGFVGRATELEWLHALLPSEQARAPEQSKPQSAAVALITGTAGVGKSTLALRFAREAAPLFPDGQLYVNLRGFDPAGAPMSPGMALQWFFDALGETPLNVPPALEAQTALLRTLLDGKRVLLLLDNAHDADQVRPLLPGGPGCMVLVTSRSQLTGLVVEGARPVPLDVLSPAEATELVASRLGADRVAAESAAVAAIVRHSAGLPLALSVTCARAVARPTLKLADLAAELADARSRLDALRTGEDTTDLRAVFSWSADTLSDAASRMFRLIGLHHGPDITANGAASLAATTRASARLALAELTRASLLTEDTAGRFGCHDLLRAYAAELAYATLSETERDLARRRMLDHYLRSAQAASARLFPARGQVALPAPLDGVTPEEFTGPEAYDAALAWFSGKHRVLRNAVEQAAARREDEHCWKLAWYWAPLLNRRARPHEILAVQETAVLAAGRLGDPNALAHVHYELGLAVGRFGDYDAADGHLREALGFFTHLGNPANVALVRHGIAQLLMQQGRYEEALDHAAAALRARRVIAATVLVDSGGTANADAEQRAKAEAEQRQAAAAVAYSENSVGWILAHLEQPDPALWYCRRALDMHIESGSRTGMADTLDSLGYAFSRLGEYAQSVAHYERALAAYRQLGDLPAEANTRVDLGDVQFESGHREDARRSWEEALALLAQLPGADLSVPRGRLRRAADYQAEHAEGQPAATPNTSTGPPAAVR